MIKEYFPYEHAKSVFVIDYEKLYKLGYKGIIFDIDNTLVHHNDNSTPEIDELFKQIHKIGLKTVLLTNNSEERVKRFIKNIDTLYVCEAEKPDTKGYYKAVELLEVEKEQAIVVGDQVFVDILGANRSGLASILVNYIILENETKIGKKRYIEKMIMWFYRKSKKYKSRLGNIIKN